MDFSQVLKCPDSRLQNRLEQRGWVVYRGFDEPLFLALRGDGPSARGVWPRTAALPFSEGTVEAYLEQGSELEAQRLVAEAVGILAEAAFEGYYDLLRGARKTLHDQVCQALTAARLEFELQADDAARADLEPGLRWLDEAVTGVRRVMEDLRPLSDR